MRGLQHQLFTTQTCSSWPTLPANTATTTKNWGSTTRELECRGTSGTRLLGISVYEHPLLDITIFSSLQASDASRLPLLNQQNAGRWKEGACPRYPQDAPEHNVPSAPGGQVTLHRYIHSGISQCSLKTIRAQRHTHNKEKSNPTKAFPT